MVSLIEDDLDDVLTPNHLIIVKISEQKVMHILLKIQHQTNRKQKHSSNKVLKVGDIALIKGEENVPPSPRRIGKGSQVRGVE